MVYPSRYSLRLEKARSTSEADIYLSQVWESDGFDIDHVEGPSHCEMLVFKCKKLNDCLLLVRLYAKMGLHRYNMLNIKKYNRYVALIPSSYFIYVVVRNPATRSLEPFQTRIHERQYNQMDVTCYVARLKNIGTKGTDWKAPQFPGLSVPKWPKDAALADRNRFYMVHETEWQENDWIRLYLELAFVTTHRRIPSPKLYDLKIVEFIVETKEKVLPPNAKLKGFRDATVHNKYNQDLGEGRVCKRIAIVRRSKDLIRERISLMGDDFLESESDSDHEATSNK